ncbi:MAG: histidine phosphatase family protein [Streptosporangiales bacterium]
MHGLTLVRHGETAWSREGKHTGRTDIPLTEAGRAAARSVASLLSAHDFVLAVSSPLSRARLTAELAGLSGVRIDEDLHEWDYGAYEGRTTPEILAERPGWYLWADGVPPGDAAHPGENVAQVGARADRALARVRPGLEDGPVVLVGHGHALRVLVARWLDLPPDHGRFFELDTAAVSVLGTEHGKPVIARLNSTPWAS